MHADYFNFWIAFFHRAGHARDQSAAANGNDQRVKIAMLLEHFQAERSLPGDHGLIVKRVNERKAEFFRAANGFLTGFIVIRAGQNYFRAVAARGGHFHERRGQRHADLRLDAALGGVIRHGLGMVARRCGDHAAPALLFREQKDLVQRAAFLERAGHLQILQLQEDSISSLLRKFFGVHKGRNHNRAPDAFPRILDGSKRHHRKSPECCFIITENGSAKFTARTHSPCRNPLR